LISYQLLSATFFDEVFDSFELFTRNLLDFVTGFCSIITGFGGSGFFAHGRTSC